MFSVDQWALIFHRRGWSWHKFIISPPEDGSVRQHVDYQGVKQRSTKRNTILLIDWSIISHQLIAIVQPVVRSKLLYSDATIQWYVESLLEARAALV